jgi:hypothetical protein
MIVDLENMVNSRSTELFVSDNVILFSIVFIPTHRCGIEINSNISSYTRKLIVINISKID